MAGFFGSPEKKAARDVEQNFGKSSNYDSAAENNRYTAEVNRLQQLEQQRQQQEQQRQHQQRK